VTEVQQLSGLFVHLEERIKVLLLKFKDLPKRLISQCSTQEIKGQRTSKLSRILFGFTVFGTAVHPR
jgi:hypothetical protein